MKKAYKNIYGDQHFFDQSAFVVLFFRHVKANKDLNIEQ